MIRVIISSIILIAVSGVASAETFDVTTFTAPKGWTRAEQPDAVVLQIVNEKAGAAAAVTISRSAASAGEGRANFDRAWSALVAPVLKDAPAPTMIAATRDGWKIVRGTTKHTFEGRAGAATILTATRDATHVLVIVMTIGGSYQKDVDKLLASLRFAAPTPAPTAKPEPTPAAPAGDLTGAWGFSSGGELSRGASKAWLSDRREYTFDGKGNYTFARRHNIDHDPDTSIIRERGTYSLSGDVLSLKPSASERQIWKKTKTGAYEKLIKREKVALEKSSYRISFTVYPNTQVPNLMLEPSTAKQTEREGMFNASTQYRLFRPDNNYYTPIPPTP